MPPFFTFNKSLVVRWGEGLICILFLLLAGCREDPDFPVEEYRSRIIAHRGYWKRSGVPENSLQSFVDAASCGLYGCEIDVWETADGEFVVNHDAAIDSCVIAEMNYNDLRGVLSDERICEKLSSFLEILPDYPEFKLLIEIKNASIPALLRLISLYDVADQVEFQSFSPEVCRALADNHFAGRVLLISETRPPLSYLEPDVYSGYSLYYFRLDKGYLWHSHALGFLVYVWTVDSKKRAKQLLDMGVDYVIMDYSE